MSQITYEKVIISREAIKAAKAHVDAHRGTMAAYAAFMSLNSVLGLYRDQSLRHHYGYLEGVTKRVQVTHCICGMIVPNSLLKKVKVVHGLEPIQLLSGHVRMPEDDGFTAAFITGFEWVEAKKDHRWQVFCQGCQIYVAGFTFGDAKQWVQEHEGHLS